MTVKVIIPFRAREGGDPRRQANLDVVLGWWYGHGFEADVVSDGLSGDAQFNRHRAYNDGVSRNPDADVFVFAEADMLVHPDQIKGAVQMARKKMGLVVPFTQYRYLSDSVTTFLRNAYSDLGSDELAEWFSCKASDPVGIFDLRAEHTMEDGKSIGAVNVVSRDTLRVTGGFTEATSGNWYDDNIIEEGFAAITYPTRWVRGPAVHMYHLPGHSGDHLTDADKAATAENKRILTAMRKAIKNSDRAHVRRLMEVRQDRGVK